MPKVTTKSPMNLSLRCPNCGDIARCRTSVDITPIAREAHFECRQLACGMAWKASIEMMYVIRPSMTPRPDLNLPTSPRAIRTAANDSGPEVPLPEAANDEAGDAAQAL